MDLPRTLQHWQKSLSIFPHDLAIALGGIVDQLSMLLGPIDSPTAAGHNEPDGFDGIGRRGSFERLLTSEWALAEEAPLEFLRRVSTGELSFLEVAHKKPTIAKSCLVLFDVGPDQHGGPRIAHLAALILLAQRAHDTGASFSWGIVQDQTRAFISDVNEESVRNLLKPGGSRRATIHDVIDYYKIVQDDNTEIWFVGGSGSQELLEGIGANRIEIDDSYEPERPYDLHVSVIVANAKPRKASLEMPPSNIAVRVLRDPFQVARTTTHKSKIRLARDTNIVFSRDQRKLFLLGSAGELLTIPIPNSPNSRESPKPRVFRPPPGERIIGAGRLYGTRKIAAVTQNSQEVIVHELSPRASASVKQTSYSRDRHTLPTGSLPNRSSLEDLPDESRLGVLIQVSANGTLLFYDGKDSIFRLETDGVRFSEQIRPPISLIGGSVAWLRPGSPPNWIQFHGETSFGLELQTTTAKVFNCLSGLLALNISATKWQIWNERGSTEHAAEIPIEYDVLGVANSKHFLFYVLDATRKCISYFEHGNKDICVTTSSPIKSIVATPGCTYIAFVTEEDELCVYSREHKTLLLHLRLGET